MGKRWLIVSKVFPIFLVLSVLLVTLLFPTPSAGFGVAGPFYEWTPPVEHLNYEEFCPWIFTTYSFTFTPGAHIFHFFIMLGPGERAPADYLMGGTRVEYHNGIWIWSGAPYPCTCDSRCPGMTWNTYFQRGCQTISTPVAPYRFAGSTCERLNTFSNGAYTCDDNSVRVGEVQVNLVAGGGSYSVSDAVGGLYDL